jgi:hypothetical protein
VRRLEAKYSRDRDAQRRGGVTGRHERRADRRRRETQALARVRQPRCGATARPVRRDLGRAAVARGTSAAPRCPTRPPSRRVLALIG